MAQPMFNPFIPFLSHCVLVFYSSSATSHCLVYGLLRRYRNNPVTSPTGHLNWTSACIFHFGPITIEDGRMIRATDSSPGYRPMRAPMTSVSSRLGILARRNTGSVYRRLGLVL